MSLEFWCPLRLEAAAARRGVRRGAVERSGMGSRRAAAFASGRSAAGHPPREAVVLGLAGALSDAVVAGEVIVADTVRGPGADRSAAGRGSEAAVERLQEAGIDVVRGPVRSVERLVRGAERRRLAADGTLAVDMESWWLLGATPPPLAVIRVICDTPAAELFSLSLPLRARRAMAVLSRIAAVLDSQGVQPGREIRRGLRATASGGKR